MPEQQDKQIRSIPDRNQLMQQLLDENGVTVPTPSPSPTPQQQKSFGQMLARLLGLG
jgi:hypothetical protein